MPTGCWASPMRPGGVASPDRTCTPGAMRPMARCAWSSRRLPSTIPTRRPWPAAGAAAAGGPAGARLAALRGWATRQRYHRAVLGLVLHPAAGGRCAGVDPDLGQCVLSQCCWRIHSATEFPSESATYWCLEFWAGVVTFEFASNILSCEQVQSSTTRKTRSPGLRCAPVCPTRVALSAFLVNGQY
jgi:hypothetical protein